ncbi:E3 ubiquitin-protein ligase makorin-like isoform X2 [Curcuma longa]|uniref:E3 ubiquitin-protein ligase makorin-like isoform X2 n=1 Tax=Curcuma longa TaxID=136217 RepID=UPI003D9F79DC
MRTLCKFYMHGACLKGDHCEFSHDWQDQANNICTFYQKGVCSYGSRCRYDHVKVSRSRSSGLSSFRSILSTNPHPCITSDSQQVSHASVVPLTKQYNLESSTSIDVLAMKSENRFPVTSAWTSNSEPGPCLHDELRTHQTYLRDADRPICSFAAAGQCPYGERCARLHGDMCTICGKHCLHPFRADERDDHIKMCQKNNMHLEALKYSQEIECSVCLDRVLSKPTAAERKFGLLSECDHPFCISCIRNWRNNSSTSGMDINSALRACPICRKLSYFVIPSVIWFSTKEEKQEIIDSYKTKLKSINCKYFDFGNRTCPFGTSCFYKHAYRDGRLEEVVLRHLDAEDGGTIIAKNIRKCYRSKQVCCADSISTVKDLSCHWGSNIKN